MEKPFTHCVFSDESRYNTGQYRSIGMISMPLSELNCIENDLLDICNSFEITNLRNFKWNKLTNHKKRDAAKNIMEYIVERAIEEKLRVDVLVWDIKDSRHEIRRRDDIENLQRMYYHLLNNVLLERWPGMNVWKIYPDQNTALNWEDMASFLENNSLVAEIIKSDDGPFLSVELKNRCVLNIDERSSSDSVLIQSADLFAGMGRYSKENYNTFEGWLIQNTGQTQLIPSNIRLSNKDKNRCAIMNDFNVLCKSKKLGVSLKSSKGFKTFNPRNMVNFWMYTPQSKKDKAPTLNKH